MYDPVATARGSDTPAYLIPGDPDKSLITE